MVIFNEFKKITPLVFSLLFLITGLLFISISQAKIIRYKRADGTIVMKSVPNDWIPPKTTKDGALIKVMRTQAKTTSDNQNFDLKPFFVSKEQAALTVEKVVSKPVDQTKKIVKKLDKADFDKLINRHSLESEKITYMGLSAILGLCLLVIVIIFIFVLKHYRRAVKSLEINSSDTQARLQEQQAKYKESSDNLFNEINDKTIQTRAVIQKFNDIAVAKNVQNAVKELFHLIAMYDNNSRVVIYITDFELDQIYAWKYFNISADTAAQRVYSISDNCLMNLCMTRKIPLSILDAENDTIIDRTINMGLLKCSVAIPILERSISKACLCIEGFSEGFEFNNDFLNTIKSATAILSGKLSVSGIYNLTKEQVILGQIPGALSPESASSSTSLSSGATNSFLLRTVSEKIADQLRKYPDLIKHSSGIRKGTLVYTNIDNFNTISEKLEPFELIDYLNVFYESMKEIIFKYDGTIDTTSHGEIIAFWGGPITQKYHASMAAQACLRMFSVLKRRNSSALANNLPEIKMGISISSGDLILGRVGPKNRCDYSVVGSELEIVKELQSFSAQYNVNIVLTGATQEIIENEIETREIDMVKLFGRQTMLYHITGLKNLK